ncbi:MAG TPA: hypothetical protein VGE41_00460, partial [Verrucomicrobiae bacterium]
MKFPCPHCGQRLEAESSLVGQQIGCPICAKALTIPAEAPVAAVTQVRTVAPIRKRRIPILAVIATAVLLLGGAGWFLFANEGAGVKKLSSLVPGALNKRTDLADVKVFPPEINLSTRQDRQSVVVQAIYADGVTRDVTAEASFSLANKALARLDKANLYPLADGKTELQIKYEGRNLNVPVIVEQAAVERPISFKMDVMPVFSKAGCNSGACHGSSRGKDGFRLSLFGFDPDGDYFRLTQENIGRRVNLGIPEESLLLEKGLGRVPHSGGERFKADSELYKNVLRWLGAGAPKDGTNVSKVVGLEIMPRQAVLEGQGAAQKLTVRAKYSDGSDRDVS